MRGINQYRVKRPFWDIENLSKYTHSRYGKDAPKGDLGSECSKASDCKSDYCINPPKGTCSCLQYPDADDKDLCTEDKNCCGNSICIKDPKNLPYGSCSCAKKGESCSADPWEKYNCCNNLGAAGCVKGKCT